MAVVLLFTTLSLSLFSLLLMGEEFVYVNSIGDYFVVVRGLYVPSSWSAAFNIFPHFLLLYPTHFLY